MRGNKILFCTMIGCLISMKAAMERPRLGNRVETAAVVSLREAQQGMIKFVTDMHTKGSKICKRVTQNTIKYSIVGPNYSETVTFFCNNVSTGEGLYLCQKKNCNYEGFPEERYSDARTKFTLFRKAYEWQQRLGLGSQEEQKEDNE